MELRRSILKHFFLLRATRKLCRELSKASRRTGSILCAKLPFWWGSNRLPRMFPCLACLGLCVNGGGLIQVHRQQFETLFVRVPGACAAARTRWLRPGPMLLELLSYYLRCRTHAIAAGRSMPHDLLAFCRRTFTRSPRDSCPDLVELALKPSGRCLTV